MREHLGGIYDFLESRKLDSLRELEQRATVSKTEKNGNISKDSASPAKSEDSKLSYGEQKEFARRLRKAEKVVADIESEIAGLENNITGIIDLIVINASQRDFNRPCCHIIDKRPVVKNQYDRIGASR